MSDRISISGIRSVIFFGTDSPASLPAIRALGNEYPEISIHGVSRGLKSSKHAMFSRYLSSHHFFDPNNDDELVTRLIDLINKKGADILLPVDERDYTLISKYSLMLKQHVNIPPVSSVELLQKLIDKAQLSELLKNEGEPFAKTVNLNEGKYDLPDMDFFPCLLKPVNHSEGRQIIMLNSRSELETLLQENDIGKSILQEFIPGYDIDCSFLAVDGELKAYTIQKALISRGYVYSTAIQFEHNNKILEAAKTFVKKVNYSGIAHLDYRLDERDGEPKLVDFNARYWSSLLGSNAAGINFTALNCLEAKGINYEPQEFEECIYLMGRSVFNLFDKNIYRPAASKKLYTDIRYRVKDVLPEMAIYTEKISRNIFSNLSGRG